MRALTPASCLSAWPLPPAYKGSSEVFIDANLQLALAAAKQVCRGLWLPRQPPQHPPDPLLSLPAAQLSKAGKSVQIIVPDAPELDRAEKRFGNAASLVENVSFGALSGARRTGLAALLGGLGNSVAPASAGLTKPADVYLIVNLSCVELQPLETFVNERMPPGSTAVTFNLELDTQRGDLGLPGFPGKDLHYRFLSRFLPVLYLRPRAYSKTVAVAPFLLNYSGATFREYPGPWQVMLRADSGDLACIAERVEPRYGLGEAKEEMLAAMGLNTEDEGSSLAFLRRGYKTATWWEEGGDQEASAAWRS